MGGDGVDVICIDMYVGVRMEKMNKEREKKSVVGNWGTSTRQVDPLSVVHVLEGAFTWS
jgi:hypothetical protein